VLASIPSQPHESDFQPSGNLCRFTPVRNRSNSLEAGSREEDGHPPFDILKHGEDTYLITLAVAGSHQCGTRGRRAMTLFAGNG